MEAAGVTNCVHGGPGLTVTASSPDQCPRQPSLNSVFTVSAPDRSLPSLYSVSALTVNAPVCILSDHILC